MWKEFKKALSVIMRSWPQDIQWSHLCGEEPQPPQQYPEDPVSSAMLVHLLGQHAQSEREEILTMPNVHERYHLKCF